MKKLALAAMILTSVALSGNAFARTFKIHGTMCFHTLSNFAYEYDQYGVHNFSGNSGGSGPPLIVECPLPLSYPSSGVPPLVTQVQATVYDRSTTDNVSCVLEEVDQAGNVVISIEDHTMGGGPGAPSIPLTFVPTVAVDASGYWRLRCSIPSSPASGVFSHLTTIVVNTTE
jgi:hypothetical protein